MRNTAITLIVDADQRQVVLPIVARTGQTVTVKGPPGPRALGVHANKRVSKVQCASRRSFTVRLRTSYRKRAVRASFAVDGKRVAKQRVHGPPEERQDDATSAVTGLLSVLGQAEELQGREPHEVVQEVQQEERFEAQLAQGQDSAAPTPGSRASVHVHGS